MLTIIDPFPNEIRIQAELDQQLETPVWEQVGSNTNMVMQENKRVKLLRMAMAEGLDQVLLNASLHTAV